MKTSVRLTVSVKELQLPALLRAAACALDKRVTKIRRRIMLCNDLPKIELDSLLSALRGIDCADICRPVTLLAPIY